MNPAALFALAVCGTLLCWTIYKMLTDRRVM